jgi:chromosome segregation ATPase
LKRVQESDRVDFAVKTEVISVPTLHQQVEMPVTSDILGQPLTEEKAGEVEDTGGFFSHVIEFAQEQEVEAPPQTPVPSTTAASTIDMQTQWSQETSSLEQELETLMQEEATAQAQVTALEMQIEALKQRQESTKEKNVEMTKELEKQHRTAVLISSAATDVVSLKQEIQENQQKMEEMKREWEAYKAPLVDEVRGKRERIEQLKENYTDKIEEIKQMKEDLQDMANEAQMKDEMIDLLTEEEAKSSTNLNRNAFIQRITEVIEKLKRQKHEIGKILKDVQDMQSSIAFNRDTLKRVDSATEDMVFQEAKKDASSKVMYKMLTDLRVVYEELIRAVEEQNAVKNSIRDVEIRLDSVKTRNVNHDIARLREDLDKVREESKRR